MVHHTYTCDNCDIAVTPLTGLYEYRGRFFAPLPADAAEVFKTSERHACTQFCADKLSPPQSSLFPQTKTPPLTIDGKTAATGRDDF